MYCIHPSITKTKNSMCCLALPFNRETFCPEVSSWQRANSSDGFSNSLKQTKFIGSPSLQEYINSKDGGESLSDKPNCEEDALSRAGAGSRDQSSSLGKGREQSRCLEEGHIKWSIRKIIVSLAYKLYSVPRVSRFCVCHPCGWALVMRLLVSHFWFFK